MVLQAMSGLMTAQGGDDEPVINTMPIVDVTTAALLVLGASIALYHQRRTGEGQRVWASLAATSALLQAGESVRYAGRPTPPRGGRDYQGSEPLNRYYLVADGWLRVQAPSSHGPEPQELYGCLGIESADHAAFDEEAIASALRTIAASDAVARLRRVGVAAVPARRISQVIRDPNLLAREFVHVHTAADSSLFTTPGRYAHFSRTSRTGALLPPGSGEHSAEVLREAGLTDREIDDLIEAGAISAGTRMEYRLPLVYR
jgi:crotonobetainyl-CoA:carnitine CoA-transferase CaiB-like acyl-CoA transferase